jgi:alkylation response protein AidB-like acyl-CoA dehydrogenase
MKTAERVRQSDSGVELLEAARYLAPLIADHADAAERDRRVPKAVIDALASAGIFHMFVPRVFAGGETDVAGGVRVLEELSRVDGSTGWVAMIGATTGVISAYLPEHVSREVYRPGVITGGVVAPRGTAVPEGEGYRVNGRWPFASGCEHSRWLACACIVRERGGSGEREEPAEVRMALFPASVVEIIDTWHVSGLRGTGSHDISVTDALVPRDYSYSMSSPPVQAGVLYGFSLMGLLAVSVAAVALGIGRAALDEIHELSPKKTPVGRRKPLTEWSVAQIALAEGEAALRAGRAFLFEAAGGMWGTLERGEQPSRDERALVRLAASQAVQGAVRAVDIAYNLGGGSSIYESSRLQRQFRDIHAVTQHVSVGPSSMEAAGRVLLGQDVPPGFL